MKAKKILFITQEMIPYVPESNLSVMGRKLPQSIQEKGREIRTFMPKWGNINERRNQLHEVIRLSGMNLIIDDTDHPLIIKVASIPAARMQVYFIDNDDYFMKRQMGTDENGEEYDDNAERAIFYARGVLETVKKLRWTPDVIHCQGWMAALVPLFVKTAYKDEPSFCDTKVIYALHQDELRKNPGSNFGNCISFRNVGPEVLDEFSQDFTFEEMNKLAVKYADGLILADPQTNPNIAGYAQELGKPVLEYPGEDYAAEFAAFYDRIWSLDKEEEETED